MGAIDDELRLARSVAEKMLHRNNEAWKQLEALRARIRTLEGLLRPFTTSRFGSELPDDKTAPSVCFLNVTVGDVRRAKAALDGGAE